MPHTTRSRTPARPYRKIAWPVAAMLIATLAAMLAGCNAQATTDATDSTPGRLGVVVSILPQQYFVERIGGDHVAVSVMVGPGDDPHTYEPKPEQLKAVSNATVYFATGVEFEHVWMDRIAAANPAMQIVDTTAGMTLLPSTEHDHEGESQSTTAELDPHVWTSPRLVAQQASLIAATLTKLDPDHAGDYDANLRAFEADITALDADLQATLAGVKGGAFMVFHPSWGYFARDYGLEQLAIEVGGQEPSAQELAMLIETARARNIKVVFAQPEFSTSDAETIAREINGKVLLISPLEKDWLTNMRTVAETFRDALAPTTP